MSLTTVTITIPQRVKDKLLGLAQIEGRSAGRVFESALDAYQQPQTTSPSPQAQKPKRKYKLIPEGQPTRVVMEGVEVYDANTHRARVLERTAVSFGETRGSNPEITAYVHATFIDYTTGDPVESMVIDTPEGREVVSDRIIKLVNPSLVIRRWLNGLYEEVENWEEYRPAIVRVREGKMWHEMGTIVPGRFVPSEEQLKEYREDREWTEAQIERFIELRSAVVPGGPQWVERLDAMYLEVNKMGAGDVQGR